ncbi:hypothetical protein ACYZT3_28150 [Pseudomonas sp. MDT1-16]
MSRKLRILADGPDRPDRLSESDEAAVIASLMAQAQMASAHAQRASAPYAFEATWLLEGTRGSLIWKTANGGKEEYFDGGWRNTIDVNFSALLSDGTDLIDQENRALLLLLQDWAFNYRSGLLNRACSGSSWKRAVAWFKTLINWMVCNENLYKPHKSGLSLLDENGISNLLGQLSKGGWAEALDVNNRVLRHIASSVGYVGDLSIIDAEIILPQALISSAQNFYYGINNFAALTPDRNALSRSYIAKKLGISVQLLNSPPTSLLLSKFHREHPYHLKTAHSESGTLNNHQMESTSTQAEPSLKEGAYKKHFYYLSVVLAGYRQQPSAFPNINDGKLSELYFEHRCNTSRSLHVKTIPLPIGLATLRCALKWVNLYGEEIVKAAHKYMVYKVERAQQKSMAAGQRKKDDVAALTSLLKSSYIHSPSTGECQSLYQLFDIDVENNKLRGRKKHTRPTFLVIVQALIGACTMCIGFLKPSRIDELSELERDCVILKGFAHKNHWLKFSLGKSGDKGINNTVEKPIPSVTAMAISLLQDLGDCMVNLHGVVDKISAKLFYLPTGHNLLPPRTYDFEEKINNCLDAFVDLCDLPVDQNGKKTYVRVHEMRRFFIIMMFYHGKFQVLDAVRDIAGHTDASHTYAYITENSDYDEIIKIELSLIDQKLINHELKTATTGSNSLIELHSDICSKFNVSKIESIPKNEYLDFLADLRCAGALEVTVYSIEVETDEGLIKAVDVAVKYRE